MTECIRICIVGCGAIGSLFAAHLARLEDVELWGYDVSEPHVAAIRANGLVLTGPDDFTVRFEARTDPGDIPPCELGIVATKSEHTAAAMAAVAPVLAEAAVASVQNGIGNEEVIAGFVPRVIRGTTLIAGSIPGPGAVRFDAPGETWLGPFEPQPARVDEYERLAELLNRAGLPAFAQADSRSAQWTKLVFNAATNAVGALTGLTIGQIGTSAVLTPLVDGLIAEGAAVADALGIAFAEPPRAMIDEAVRIAYGHRASMLQDVAARRHTEVAVLNGGVVAAGRSVGVPTPLHEAMVALVAGLEASWTDDPGPR